MEISAVFLWGCSPFTRVWASTEGEWFALGLPEKKRDALLFLVCNNPRGPKDLGNLIALALLKHFTLPSSLRDRESRHSLLGKGMEWIALATLGDYSSLSGPSVNVIPLIFSFFSCWNQSACVKQRTLFLGFGQRRKLLSRYPGSWQLAKAGGLWARRGVNLKGTVCCFCSCSILLFSLVLQPLAACSCSLYTKEPKGRRENFLLTFFSF